MQHFIVLNLICIVVFSCLSNKQIFHHRKNDTDIMINNRLMNLMFKNNFIQPRIVFIPRDLQPFEFELFFN